MIDAPPVMREKILAQGDAELLRKYKKFLIKYGLKEALYCQKCSVAGRDEGLRAFVTDSRIGMICRCTARHYNGATY